MLTNSFAPIRRAGLFFGFMAMGVGALTMGSGFQETNPDSSSAIAQMKIENESRLADVSDYTARIVQCENRRLGVQGIDTRVQISSHPRRDGPWTLLKRILDRVDLPS